MKRLYTIEINNKIYESKHQDDIFDEIKKLLKVKNSVSVNISYRDIEAERVYKGLVNHEEEIKAMLQDKKTYKDIAKRYGVSKSTAAAYCKKTMVHTSLEDRKKVKEAMENVWFGSKKKG